MHEQTNIHEIITNYLNDSISDEEQARLQEWIDQSEHNKQLFEQLTQRPFLANELQKLYAYDEDKGWEQVQQHIAGSTPVIPLTKRPWKLWLVAASVIGLLCIGYYMWLTIRNSPSAVQPIAIVQQDVKAPSATKAMITLANGQTVPLDSITSGLLAGQGDVHVIKNAAGEIVYQGTAAATMYNTLVNPRGGTVVSLVLQDGTKVWLNSESSLRYPVAFAGKERSVEITGEAYFEVAKNPFKKFIVTGHGVRTEVLGTHFNINTYKDEEDSKVTLLEGKVKVRYEVGSTKSDVSVQTSDLRPQTSVVLKPGQQAVLTHNSQLTTHNVDTDKVIAWTTGIFSFEDEDLPTVLRQLARWYDVEVSYNGVLSQERYSGIISRQLTLSKVLAVLQIAGVKYTIEGKKLKIEKTE